MSLKPTERIPVMPQICHDLPLYIRAAEEGTDVLDGYRECAERPEMVFEYMIGLVRRGCSLNMLCIRVSLGSARTAASGPWLASEIAGQARNWRRRLSIWSRRHTFVV